MMEKKGPSSAPRKGNGPKIDGLTDPVKNFEKWKTKYNKTKNRVKTEVRKNRKPDWEVEQEYIQRLVSKYNNINAKDAVKFSDFPLSKNTLRGLLEAQYRQPTEIQRQTIAFALQGKDVLGAAKTGSGKTLAFLIPVLECLYRHQWSAMDGLGALIISPTRELAYQTFEVLRKVGKNHEFSAGLVIGGKDLRVESEKIHRTNIVICTPGRLLQHMDETATFHASELHMLVLDEADRILDMGFADTVNAIVENLPATRQTLLFSATQTKSVKDLARLSLKDPEYVWVHENAKFSTPATLEQNYVVCELHQKVNMLYSFIRSHLQKKVMVFFACCKEVQYLFRVFCRLRPGTPVLALHGKQQQMKRVEVYNDFLRKKHAVLFATDIAARGLDFPAVNWVLQFDCPEDADTYIHRVGRTARYKEGGEALMVLLPSEEGGMLAQLRDKKVPINKIQVNPDKLQDVQQKLEAFLAQESEQKERAQRCFVSYLRSVFLQRNKAVFDVRRLALHPYALSLGLAVAPRVRFLARGLSRGGDAEPSRFREQPGGGGGEGGGKGTSSGESDSEEDERAAPRPLLSLDDDDDDLKDLDLLTVKTKNVFGLTEGAGEESEGEEPGDKADRRAKKVTRFSEAKRILKKKFKVNTKVTFTEEGSAVQQWPPAQRCVTGEDEEGDEGGESGIDVEKARARLQREDREYDKQEYSRKVREKHRERRLKARATSKETGREAGGGRGKAEDGGEEDDEEDDDDEEEEVVAYLAHHGDMEEFDPSTLPDPDRLPREEEVEEEEHSTPPPRQWGKRRRASSSEEEEERAPPTGAGKRARLPARSKALDTGLSLAEDEELVLHLLGSRST